MSGVIEQLAALAQAQAERTYELEQREHRLARVQPQQQPAPPFDPMRAALTRRAQRQRAMLHRIGGIADDQQH